MPPFDHSTLTPGCFECDAVACSAASVRKRLFVEESTGSIASVPDDVLDDELIARLGVKDLAGLACVSQRFSTMAASEARWLELFVEQWGEPSELHRAAHKLAGSWRKLYASKHTTSKTAEPWMKPCEFELKALTGRFCNASNAEEVSVVFLVDGSGSVSEEDFEVMRDFITSSCTQLQASSAQCKVCVLQFSNDVRVEQPLAVLEPEALQEVLKSMVRISGGTNIAYAITKAAQLLKEGAGEGGSRTLVLLTDGRVDGYQAREAAAMVSRLADEQAAVSMYALGVGRGVDRAELLKVVAPAGSGEPSSRYLDLCVRDDAPW